MYDVKGVSSINVVLVPACQVTAGVDNKSYLISS